MCIRNGVELSYIQNMIVSFHSLEKASKPAFLPEEDSGKELFLNLNDMAQ